MALGILLALIGGAATFFVVNSNVNAPPPAVIPKKDILVAKTNIPERTQLNPGLVDKKPWPEDVIPPGALAAVTGTANLANQFTLEPIRQGQPIVDKALTAGSTISYTTFPWPAGKVLVAVPFAKANDLIQSGALKEGSTVDMILNLGGQYVVGMQNLKIFAIGQLDKPPPVPEKDAKAADPAAAKTTSTLFLFNVTPEDALTLKFLADLNPDFWVRSPTEPADQQFNVPAVNAAYIANRFRLQGLTLPTTPAPGQPTAPGQPAPGQPAPGQPAPGQPGTPGQPGQTPGR